MLKHWVIVADASQARVMEMRGSELTVVRELDNAAGRARSQNLVSDQAGRTNKSGRRIRSAMDPPTSPHEKQVNLFASRLAKLLDAAAEAGDYERLTLVAPPHLLGLLRNEISRDVRRRLSGQIAKDLVHADLSSVKTVVAEAQDIRNVAD